MCGFSSQFEDLRVVVFRWWFPAASVIIWCSLDLVRDLFHWKSIVIVRRELKTGLLNGIDGSDALLQQRQ